MKGNVSIHSKIPKPKMVIHNSSKILVATVLLTFSCQYQVIQQTPAEFRKNTVLVPTKNMDGNLALDVNLISDTLASGDSLELELVYRNLSDDSLFVFTVSPYIFIEPVTFLDEDSSYLTTLEYYQLTLSRSRIYLGNPIIFYVTEIPRKSDRANLEAIKSFFGAYDTVKILVSFDVQSLKPDDYEYRLIHDLNDLSVSYDTIKDDLPEIPLGVDKLQSNKFRFTIMN